MNEYLVDNIEADIGGQRLRTQQVQVTVLFDFHFDFRTRHATVTRDDFYVNENWLYDLLTSLVPFGQWERVVVRATTDPGYTGADTIYGGLYADPILFDRTADQNEPFLMERFQFLLQHDMLGIIDQDDIDAGYIVPGWEDRVPVHRWTLVIRRVRRPELPELCRARARLARPAPPARTL